VDPKGNNNITPLHFAVQEENGATVALLLANGANANVVDKAGGAAPLHFAAQRDDSFIVKLLLATGAIVDVKDKKGYTPLFAAAINGHREIADLLLVNGANVNAKNNIGWTPLYLAAQQGHIDMMKLLIANGADVNARDKDSRTPLHLQGYKGNVAVVELLVASGADLNAKDNMGRTPLDDAAKYGSAAVVDTLTSKGAKGIERDRVVILPFSDCADTPGSGQAFTNVLYSTLAAELESKYDVIDLTLIEGAISELKRAMPIHSKAQLADAVGKKFDADLIVTGDLTAWKRGGWTKMPIVGFSVHCRSITTSSIVWSISHSDSVWMAALERRVPEIAAGEVIKKALKKKRI